MGRPKAALPLTDRRDTFVGRLTHTFVASGIPDVVIVTGAHAEVVRAAAPADRRVRFVHNPDWAKGQLSSLQAALRASSRASPLVEAIVVTLVDVPLVAPSTVAAVVSHWRLSRAPIVRPARGDEHGHPVLFDRVLFDELLSADLEAGAKVVVRAHSRAILNVPVDDPGAFLDVDTEADYDALRATSVQRT